MYKEKIDRYIDAHKNEMLEDLAALVAVESTKSSYRAGMPYGKGCFDALHEALHLAECYGFSINNYDNYVGAVDLNEGEPQLDILAHLDVVPAGDGWTVTKPFEALVKGGKIYGRGTADDKGPAVAALYAMRAVRELGIPVTKNVRLILGTDEECGSSDIAHYYNCEKEAPMTFSPDAEFPVINLEKGLFQAEFSAEFEESAGLPRLVSLEAGTKVNMVPAKAEALFEGLETKDAEEAIAKVSGESGISFTLTAERGLLKIEALGRNGHASTPEMGKNALTGLLALIDRLPLAACPKTERIHALNTLMPHGEFDGAGLHVAMADEASGPLTLAFTMLSVGDGTLSGAFDARCPVCSNEENTLAVVRERMAACGITLNTDSMIPPHYVPAESEFVQTLLRCYERVTKKKGECLSIGGLTYVHHLKNGVAFGASMPGTDNHMHGPDEFAVIDDLLASAKIFALAIAELCK